VWLDVTESRDRRESDAHLNRHLGYVICHFHAEEILPALLQRHQTGEGQWVHTSWLEGNLNQLSFQGARYAVAVEIPM